MRNFLRFFSLSVVAAGAVAGCSVDPAGLARTCTPHCVDGETCVRGVCVAADGGRDAGADMDGSFDSGVGDAPADVPMDVPADTARDSGLPTHCSNAVRDSDESDVDCGGSCAPCAVCLACSEDSDCADGRCAEGLCVGEVGTLRLADGATIPAFVRADGAVLLAHYEAGATNRAYDVAFAQRVDRSGGGAAPVGWAPHPCQTSGHLPLSSVPVDGRRVLFECGTSRSDLRYSAASSLIESFDPGVHGAVGAEGDPGWAAIASVGSGDGRVNHAMCGVGMSSVTGGLAYCDGARAGSLYATHVVSYTTSSSGFSFFGCGRAGCDGPLCELAMWAWLLP